MHSQISIKAVSLFSGASDTYHHGATNPTLRGAARSEWPTPKEVDGRTKGNAGLNRNSPGLDALAKDGLLAEENPSTPGSHPAEVKSHACILGRTVFNYRRRSARIVTDWQ